MTSPLRFSLRNLWRDLRSGEIKVLLVALIVAVTSMSTINFFTDRMGRAILLNASDLLAADLVITSSEPIRTTHIKKARDSAMGTAFTTTFLSSVLNSKQSTTALANIKVVSAGYPLRGQLEITDKLGETARKTRQIPKPGEVWLESQLMHELRIRPGATVKVGKIPLRFTRILTHEPDRGLEFFNIAPRLMMHQGDLAATGLIQTGSRVKYRFLVAGSISDIESYSNWLKSKINKNERIESIRDARPEMRDAIDRGKQYLSLASILSVILAGIAIAIAAQRFANRHMDQCAVLRCLGATQSDINKIYFLEMLWIGLIGSAIGVILGFLAHQGLASLLVSLTGSRLPAPGYWPILSGILIGVVTLIGFAISPIMQLNNTPPLRVIRRDLGAPAPARTISFAVAIAAMLFLFLWQAGGATLAILILLIGGPVVFMGLYLATSGLLQLLHRIRLKRNLAWLLGMTQLARRAKTTRVQIVGLGLGMLALFILGMVRTDLLDQWQARLPANAPNQFVINIQTNQVKSLQAYLKQKLNTQPVKLYPMIRGRLIQINGRYVSADDYKTPRAKRLINREFNLSWANKLQKGNQLLQGRWWSAGQPAAGSRTTPIEMSIEHGIAKTLGIKLGDKVTYIIAGEQINAVIRSVRFVDWGTMRPNFFVLAAPGVLDDYPATWIASFHLPAGQQALITEMKQQFPNITIIDVMSSISHLRKIMRNVVLAIEYVFLFTLIAGVVVLYAVIEATQDERKHEGALLRSLGARRTLLLKANFTEFFLIGAIAGLIASLGATLAAWYISSEVFKFDFTPGVSWIVFGLLGTGLGVAAAGLLGTIKVSGTPPAKVLRDS